MSLPGDRTETRVRGEVIAAADWCGTPSYRKRACVGT